MKLWNRIKWSLPSEQWASIRRVFASGAMAFLAFTTVAVCVQWAYLFNRIQDAPQMFLYSLLGAMFITVAVLAWILFVALVYATLFPVRAMRKGSDMTMGRFH